jgi:hypothetical protein
MDIVKIDPPSHPVAIPMLVAFGLVFAVLLIWRTVRNPKPPAWARKRRGTWGR